MKAAVTTTAALLLAVAHAPAAHAAASTIAPRQEVVALLTGHDVRSRPKLARQPTGSVAARRPITAARTVLPVLGRTVDDHGRGWVRVRLPGRALGGTPPPRTGWIRASHTRRATRAWHIVVDVGTRRVRVYRRARLVRSYAAVVGQRSTPTPRGSYFVEENVRLAADHAGAPFALATSARSSVLQEFAGGPGQIAVHGVENIGGRLGTAASHGCVRLRTAAIAWLAARISPGSPVTIT
jgi:lipoprotein-anchoring transpeptidase ErfK/SrfK